MIRDIDPIEEIRKHPGVTAGSLAALVLGAAAVLYLSQRTGPTRYQRIKSRMDPRGWVDTADLRDRLHDAVDAFRSRAEDFGDRAADFSDEARSRAGDWADDLFRSARKTTGKAAKRGGKTARRYADDALDYARDHQREGGALLAVAALAAVVGAAVLESRRPDSQIRRIARF